MRTQDTASMDRDTVYKLQDLHGALYDAALNQADWAEFLTLLTRAYGHSLAALIFHDFSGNQSNYRAVSKTDPSVSQSYDAYYGRINPLAPLSRRLLPIGEARISSNLMSAHEFHETEYYQGFFRPNNFETTLTVVLKKNEGRSVALSIALSPKWLDHDKEAISRLDFLTPHLMRAVQIQQELSDVRDRGAFTDSGLERMRAPLIVLDSLGRVISLSQNAERIVAVSDGLTIKGGLVHANDPSDNARLNSLIFTALEARSDISFPPGGVMRVRRNSKALPYEILIAPVADKALVFTLRQPAVCLFIRDPLMREDSSVMLLQRLYGLSRAESRLFQELVGGGRLEHVAERLGLKKESARTVLKTIFRKTGTHRQTELIRLGLMGLSGLAEANLAYPTD
jgi:DNA-binding CsgD family transcriptional regulator